MFDIVFLRLKKRRRIIVNVDGRDFIADAIEFAAALARVVFTGDLFDHVQAIRDLTEDGVAVVEERRGGGGDKELGSVRPGACICHGKNAGGAMAEFWMKFIRKLVTRAAAAGFGRIATLEHEAFDHAMESDVIVVSAAGKIEEIGASQRSLRRVESGVDVPGGRVNGDFDVRHGGQKTPDHRQLQLKRITCDFPAAR